MTKPTAQDIAMAQDTVANKTAAGKYVQTQDVKTSLANPTPIAKPPVPPPVTPAGAPPTTNTGTNTGTSGAGGTTENTGSSSGSAGGTPPATKPPLTTTPVGDTDYAAADRQALADAQAEYQKQAKQVQDTIDRISSGATPLSAGEQAQVDGLKSQFQSLIDTQALTNTNASGVANVRGYQTGAAEYDPNFQVKTIGSIVTAGVNKVTDLQVKEASAVASLTQAFKDDDIAAIKDSWNVYQEASKAKTDAIQKAIDDTQAAIKDFQDKQQKVQDNIDNIALTAAKGGATPEVLGAIKSATTTTDAIAAAGQYIQASANPDIAEYLMYTQQAQKAGTTPQSFSSWQTSQKYNQAYASAKATADVASLTSGTDATPIPVTLGGTTGGGSILSATGLSVAAFNFLTQGVSSMSRMTAAQRSQIMKEAQTFLNTNGIDISTFQSQYTAYNDVLQKNINRANQTKIMAGEVSGSADALMSVIDQKDLNGEPFNPLGGTGNVKPQIILDLLAGKIVNDPFAIKYGSQLTFMANDLAGYLAASRGATSPELQDQRDAANIISSGLSKRSVQAFKDSIVSNEDKVSNVVTKAVVDTQKQVWGLFGVADKYKSSTNTSDQLLQQGQQTATTVNDYITAHPDQAENVANLYTQGFTDEQVSEYLGL